MRARRGRGGVSSLGPCAPCQMVSRMLIASLISLGPCAAHVGEGAAAKPGILSPRPGEARYKNVRAGLARIPANRAVSPASRRRLEVRPVPVSIAHVDVPTRATARDKFGRSPSSDGYRSVVRITTNGYGLCDDRNPRKSIEIGAVWTVLSVGRRCRRPRTPRDGDEKTIHVCGSRHGVTTPNPETIHILSGRY